jgi:hypothetical protein
MTVFDLIKCGRLKLNVARDILKKESSKYGSDFVEMVCDPPNDNFIKALRSRDFLVQISQENGAIRLSINRTILNQKGTRWQDGISWDEIQNIKNKIGYAERCAVEIYPPENHKVDVANIRHIWVLEKEPDFMWKNNLVDK